MQRRYIGVLLSFHINLGSPPNSRIAIILGRGSMRLAPLYIWMEACTAEIKTEDTLLHHWISILAVGQTKHITGSIEHFNNLDFRRWHHLVMGSPLNTNSSKITHRYMFHLRTEMLGG